MFYVEIMNKSRRRCKPDWSQVLSKLRSMLFFVLRDFNKNWFHGFFVFVLGFFQFAEMRTDHCQKFQIKGTQA